MRLSHRLVVHEHTKLEFLIETFNLFNRDNQRVKITDDGLQSNTGLFVQLDKHIGINYFPAYYRKPTNFLRANDAFAPRQIQMALRLTF